MELVGTSGEFKSMSSTISSTVAFSENLQAFFKLTHISGSTFCRSGSGFPARVEISYRQVSSLILSFNSSSVLIIGIFKVTFHMVSDKNTETSSDNARWKMESMYLKAVSARYFQLIKIMRLL